MPGTPAPGDLAAPLTEALPRGRTRPRFEELAPGPPSWPGWIAIPIGFAAAIAGDAVAAYLLGRNATGGSPAIGLWVGFIGALVLMGGLSWLAIASIVRRRMLPPDRYRGPSIFVIFAMIELGLPFLLVPPLFAFAGGDFSALTSPTGLTAQLLLTPLSFIALLLLFVALPRALRGVRLWLGAASLRQLLIGLVAGAFIWSAAQVLAAILTAILEMLGLRPEGQQEVLGKVERQLHELRLRAGERVVEGDLPGQRRRVEEGERHWTSNIANIRSRVNHVAISQSLCALM